MLIILVSLMMQTSKQNKRLCSRYVQFHMPRVQYRNIQKTHLAVSQQAGGTHNTRCNVWRIGCTANDAQQLVGKPQTCLRYVLWSKWCLAHKAVRCVQRHNSFAVYTRTDLPHVRNFRQHFKSTRSQFMQIHTRKIHSTVD